MMILPKGGAKMEDIDNHNWAGLCCEKFYDNPETKFIELDIKGLKVLLQFCDKHADEFEDKFFAECKIQNDK